MTEAGHGLQIVSVTQEHRYILEERELEHLLLREDVRELPVVVVSVAGAYRGGKSFLLNFFLRYLSSPPSAQRDGSWLGEDSEPLAGFEWRSGIKATTMGVLMWSEPFITTLPSGAKVAILLVDTQGNFDSKSTVRDNSTIFALSTLVSSVQIYNLSHDIKEDDLQHLELFTEYGKLVNTGESSGKAFQVLEFLVRDWQFPDEDYPYGTVGGERLLRDKLEIDPNLAKEMKVLREHIRSSFEKVSCFLMPHPGFKVLKPTFKGTIKDIELDFRLQLIDLVNSIFGPEKLLPKKIYGEVIKGRDLFNYFKSYMELFNSDKIPTPENIMVMTVKAGLLSAVNDARDVYEKGMEAECGPKMPSVPAVDLKYLHEKYIKSATDFFNNKKKMGSKKEADVYLEKLTKELNDRLEQFLKSNLAKVQAAIEKAKEGYDEVIQNITKDQPLCVHAADLEKLHNAGVVAAIKIFDAPRRRVTDKKDDEREKFIKSFEKQYALQRRTNERNNNMAVVLSKMEYSQKMESKATQDPPLSDVEFRREHTKALNNALEFFKTQRNMPDNYNEDVYKFNLSKDISESFNGLKEMNKSKNRVAMKAGIDAYDTYMKEHLDLMNKCLHPVDFDSMHRAATCAAFEVFRPQKQCSAGFDTDDEDETTMKSIIDKRYQSSKKVNDSSNETAVLVAYNEYIRLMDEKCSFSVWWLLLIPYIINVSQRESYHNESKNTALEVFYSKRSDNNAHSSDFYKEHLDEIIDEAYRNNYKK